ncbi:hypothetical protein GCM10011532_13910 [Christiangramia forsetii]|uniref:Uncharacterized protein n=1 Tax=Christiangramia forsetii TaxID=411153 RepID=A0ABQ1WIG9_9FLAO|nr:hypothetical protein GCM10011532_13910 [Christiangramia forsetii]
MEIQPLPDRINTENYEEFILIQIEDQQFVFGADRKNQDRKNLGAELVVRSSSVGVLYHSLIFWGGIDNVDFRELQRLGGTIEEFLGEGIYKTGREKESNCDYFDFGVSWYSHYNTEEVGYLKVSFWDGKTLEGNFDIMVHNSLNQSQSKNITGEFKFKIE